MNVLKMVRGWVRDFTLGDGSHQGQLRGFASNRLQLPGIAQPASNILWVYAAVTARSEALRQVPLRISDAAGNLVEGGALFDLLASPNAWQDIVQFVGELEAYATVFNEQFILPVSDGGGAPTELIPLCPRYMVPIRGVHLPSGRLIALGWEYRDPWSGEYRRFTTEQVIAVLSPNPDNPLRGLNPMGPLKSTLLMDVGTRETNLSLFANGAIQNFALATDQPWTPDQAKEFLELYQDNHSGVQKAFLPDLFYGGLKPVTLGLKPEEMQSLDVLKTLTPVEICAGLRVKPAMVGLSSGETGLSQGSAGETQKQAWWSETGLSQLTRLASALQRYVVDANVWSGGTLRTRPMRAMERAAFGQWQRLARPHSAPSRAARAPASTGRGFYCWFDPDGIPELVASKRSRIEQADKMRQWGYLPDDISDYFDLGLPPHPTNVGVLPIGVQPVEDVTAGASVPLPRPAANPAPVMEGGESALRLLDDVGALLQRVDAGEAERAAAKLRRIQKQFEAIVAPQEKAAARKWSRFYVEQRQRVLERMKGAGKGAGRGATTKHAEGAKGGSRVDLTAEDLLKQVFPRDDENSFLLARLTPLWTAQLKAGWEHLHTADLAQPENLAAHPFAISDPRLAEALEARKLQGTAVNETTESILRKVFADGIEAGDTLDELAGRVADYYDEHAVGEEKGRPLTAARTQTAGIVNDGRLAAARDAGGLLKFWIHGSPKEPRPAHIDAEARYSAAPIALDRKFEVNGTLMDSPGDASAPVSETANCTCGLGFVAA
jgi:phage portal protein BeeE